MLSFTRCLIIYCALNYNHIDSLFVNASLYDISNISRRNIDTKTENLLIEILKKNAIDSHSIAIAGSTNCLLVDEILKVLSQHSIIPSMILPKSNSTGNSTKLPDIAYYNFVMIIVKNIHDFLNQLDRLASLHLWNPRSKHLVLFQDVTNVTDLKLIFVECWKRKILNIGVIVQGSDKVYTYNPYFENYLETVSPSQTYYDKTEDMNGHEICTEYIPYIGEQVAQYVKERKSYKFYGKDYGYLESFFTAVNARPHYKNLSNETISYYTYFPYRYNFWKVRRFEDVELWFTFFVTDSVFESRTEQIYPLQSNNVCIMAPKSGPKIPNVFNPYSPAIWICIVLSMLACGIANYVYNKYNKIPENGFINAFGIFIGYNLPKRYMTYRERMVLFMWSMCSLLIMGAYQGSLYRFLTILDYYPEIDTLDELHRRNISVYSYDIFVDILRKYIPKDVAVFSLGENNYQLYMREHRENAYASPHSIATYMCKAKIVSENGSPLYHLMRTCPIPMFVTYFLPYGSPYFDALNRVTIACKEAGLDLFWTKEANLYALLTGTTIMTTDHSKSVRKLTIHTLLMGFYTLMIGLSISSVIFVAEILISRYQLIKSL